MAEVQAHQREVEQLPGGEYKGAQELGGEMGTAFWSRGQWDEDGVRMEETRIFAIHPDGSGLLVLSSVYPVGDDSSNRVEQLLEVLGSLS